MGFVDFDFVMVFVVIDVMVWIFLFVRFWNLLGWFELPFDDLIVWSGLCTWVWHKTEI